MNILGLVPARGGSKGILRKNIKILHGNPLLWYTARAALGASRLSRVVLSTEDEDIARIGKECGLEVPFLRPSELAEDDSPTLPVIQHAVRQLEEESNPFDAVCLLQPTSPFRDSALIDSCIERFINSGADSLITLLSVPERYNPHFMYFQNEQGRMEYCMGERTRSIRRQEVRSAYLREGSVYITRRNIIMEKDSLYGNSTVGYLMEVENSINIDSIEDWHAAERIVIEREDEAKKNTDC